MILETWIREKLPQTFSGDWSPENKLFCIELEHLIRHREQDHYVRQRGQGTTSLLMAAALFAVSEQLTPFAVLVSRNSGKAKLLKTQLEAWGEEAQVSRYEPIRQRISPPLASNRMRLNNGGIIACESIQSSFRGQTARVKDQFVRPGLILADMEVRPESAAQTASLARDGRELYRFHQTRSPCGVAITTTFSDWI